MFYPSIILYFFRVENFTLLVFDWHFVVTVDPVTSLTISNSVLESFFLAASSAFVSFFLIKAFFCLSCSSSSLSCLGLHTVSQVLLYFLALIGHACIWLLSFHQSVPMCLG